MEGAERSRSQPAGGAQPISRLFSVSGAGRV